MFEPEIPGVLPCYERRLHEAREWELVTRRDVERGLVGACSRRKGFARLAAGSVVRTGRALYRRRRVAS